MSEDSGKPAQANQDIDLDNIEVEILIICKNANQLNQAGGFLTRRGWPTTVITDLTKAIEHLADKKPDFVLVSFSHPSPRITKLPDLITQTFNLTCLGFVETSDAQSTAKLNNVKLRYKINGQASGPSIHRTIRKILAEKFNIKSEERSSSAEREAREKEGSAIVKVKGGNTAANGPGVIMQKSSANATKDKGAQMVKGSASLKMLETQEGAPMIGISDYSDSNAQGSAIDGNLPELTEADSEMVPMGVENQRPKGQRKSLKDLAGDNQVVSESAGNMLVGKSLEDKKAKLKSMLAEVGDSSEPTNGHESETSEGSGFSLAEAEAKAAREAAEKAAEKAARNSLDRDSRNGSKQAPLMQYDETSPDKSVPSLTEAQLKQAHAKAESEKQVEAERKLAQEKAKQEKIAKEKEEAELIAKDPVRAAQSLMQKAVEAAMARYCKNPPDAEPKPLEEITYVGVFPIESESLPGYLLVVWQAPDLSSREAFLRDCETEIRAAFGSMNVAGKIGTGFWTQLPAVEFVAWADNKANFNFITAHQKREVGVAFFKTSGPIPKAQPAHAGMYAVKVKDMSTDVAVNFKTYIYLKNNKKHFMYLRNGRKLQPEQKKRLLENQVGEVLLKSVDLENLRQYLASGYLSGLIIEFNVSITSASQSTRKTS